MLETLRMFISAEGKFSVTDERLMRTPGMSSVVDYSNQLYRQTMMREQGAHSLTHSLTHLLTYSLTHSYVLTHSLTHLLTHSLTHRSD